MNSETLDRMIGIVNEGGTICVGANVAARLREQYGDLPQGFRESAFIGRDATLFIKAPTEFVFKPLPIDLPEEPIRQRIECQMYRAMQLPPLALGVHPPIIKMSRVPEFPQAAFEKSCAAMANAVSQSLSKLVAQLLRVGKAIHKEERVLIAAKWVGGNSHQRRKRRRAEARIARATIARVKQATSK